MDILPKGKNLTEQDFFSQKRGFKDEFFGDPS